VKPKLRTRGNSLSDPRVTIKADEDDRTVLLVVQFPPLSFVPICLSLDDTFPSNSGASPVVEVLVLFRLFRLDDRFVYDDDDDDDGMECSARCLLIGAKTPFECFRQGCQCHITVVYRYTVHIGIGTSCISIWYIHPKVNYVKVRFANDL
jgi:hypothetical protein